MKSKIKNLTALIEERINIIPSVTVGRKYIKVDVDRCGVFMVDRDGSIFGIKGYGKIHFGHNYGTLDNINKEKVFNEIEFFRK